MEWIKTTERLPENNNSHSYSQVPCLVHYCGEVKVLYYNHHENCWDDESGDDYFCDTFAVSHWMPLPEIPKEIIDEMKADNINPNSYEAQ